MGKTIYVADQQGLYVGSCDVGDDYELQWGESFTPPDGELKNAKLEDGSWIEASSVPEIQSSSGSNPTAEQQAITALAQQIADLTETNTQLEQAITALATGGNK